MVSDFKCLEIYLSRVLFYWKVIPYRPITILHKGKKNKITLELRVFDNTLVEEFIEKTWADFFKAILKEKASFDFKCTHISYHKESPYNNDYYVISFFYELTKEEFKAYCSYARIMLGNSNLDEIIPRDFKRV